MPFFQQLCSLSVSVSLRGKGNKRVTALSWYHVLWPGPQRASDFVLILSLLSLPQTWEVGYHRVARCGYLGWEEPGVCGSPHPGDLTRSLAADRTKVFPSVCSGPALHPPRGCPHSLNPLWIVFCPPVSRLGEVESRVLLFTLQIELHPSAWRQHYCS